MTCVWCVKYGLRKRLTICLKEAKDEEEPMEVCSDSCETHSVGKLDSVWSLLCESITSLCGQYTRTTPFTLWTLRNSGSKHGRWQEKRACGRAAAHAWDMVEFKQWKACVAMAENISRGIQGFSPSVSWVVLLNPFGIVSHCGHVRNIKITA